MAPAITQGQSQPYRVEPKHERVDPGDGVERTPVRSTALVRPAGRAIAVLVQVTAT